VAVKAHANWARHAAPPGAPKLPPVPQLALLSEHLELFHEWLHLGPSGPGNFGGPDQERAGDSPTQQRQNN